MTDKTVTLKDTKSKIMKAYEDALSTITQLKAQQFNPGEIKAREANKEAVAHIEEMDWDLGMVFTQMRKHIDGNLRSMQESLEAEKEELDKVHRAKEAVAAELKDLYGISKEAQSLAALIESQKVEKEKHEAELQERADRVEAEIEAHEERMQAERAQWGEEKERAKKEWEYAFSRECQERKDALDDAIAREKKAWLDTQEAEGKELRERSDAVAKREAELEELLALKESIPQQLEAARQEAREKANQSYQFETRALKRNNDADMKVLQHEVDTLKVAKEGLERKVTDLEAKLESAYDKIQGVAAKALEAQGNAKTTAEIQKAVASTSSGKK